MLFKNNFNLFFSCLFHSLIVILQCNIITMGITKTNLFTQEQNQLANFAKVLGHPARIAIIQHLVKANTCINSDLVQELGLAQATISQHLRELKNVGIIQGTIEGTSMCYCINQKVVLELKTKLFDILETQKSDNIDSCC